MLMDAYGREGGVKNHQNHAYVIYGCPLKEAYEDNITQCGHTNVFRDKRSSSITLRCYIT